MYIKREIIECNATPDQLWQFRYFTLGGKSAVNGAELPKALDECPVGVQRDHYAQSCYLTIKYNPQVDWSVGGVGKLMIVPIPAGLSPEMADEACQMVLGYVSRGTTESS